MQSDPDSSTLSAELDTLLTHKYEKKGGFGLLKTKKKKKKAFFIIICTRVHSIYAVGGGKLELCPHTEQIWYEQYLHGLVKKMQVSAAGSITKTKAPN